MKIKNSIFTNEKIKSTNIQIPKKLNLNYIDKGIQINTDDLIKRENKEKNDNYINLDKKEMGINTSEKNEESSSNEFENIREIENLISKSSRSINIDKNRNNYKNPNKRKFFKSLNNLEYEMKNENKNEFIFLHDLFRLRNNISQTNFQFLQKSKTDGDNNYLTIDNYLNNQTKVRSTNKFYFGKDFKLFKRSNVNKEKSLQKNEIKNIKESNFIPYNYKLQFRQNIYNSYNSKSEKSN